MHTTCKSCNSTVFQLADSVKKWKALHNPCNSWRADKKKHCYKLYYACRYTGW